MSSLARGALLVILITYTLAWFVSHLAGKFDVDLLDQCLSHTRKGVFGVYQRSSRWPERVAALNAWAELICGEALPEVDNVLRFIAR